MSIRRFLQERKGTAVSFGVVALVAAGAMAAGTGRAPAPLPAAAETQAPAARATERSIALLPAPQPQRLEFDDAGKTPLATPRPKRVRKPKPPVEVPVQGTTETQPMVSVDAPAESDVALTGRHPDVASTPEHQHESPVAGATALADNYVPGSVGSAKRRWLGYDEETAEPNDGPVTGFVTSSRKHCPPRGRHWMPVVHYHD